MKASSFERVDILNFYLARDYVRTLRAGLTYRRSKSEFLIDLLLIQTMARLEQDEMMQALGAEVLEATEQLPWLRFLAEISLGARDLVDPEEIEAGEYRCQYLFFAGERLLTLGHRDSAMAALWGCTQQDHECLERLLAERQLAILSVVREAPAVVGLDQTLRDLDQQAVAHLKANEWDRALDHMEELVDLASFFRHTRWPEWLSSLSTLYNAQGRFQDSRQLLRAHLERMESSDGQRRILRQLADTELTAQNFDEARRCFEELLAMSKASELAETRAEALNGLGIVYLRMGDFDEARQALGQALTIRFDVLGRNHPDSAVTLHNLAEALIPSDPAAAENAYRAALDILRINDPEGSRRLALAYLSLGVLLRAMGRNEEALKQFQAGIGVTDQLPELAGDEIGVALARNRDELRAEERQLVRSRDSRVASGDEIDWWRRDDRQSADALRIQFQSSVAMTELLLKIIVETLAESMSRSGENQLRIVPLHATDGDMDHFGVELIGEEALVLLVRAVGTAYEQQKHAVALRGDDRLVDMLSKLPTFGPPTPDGGLPPLPPPLAPRPVDEDPEISLTDEELHRFLSSRIFLPTIINLVEAYNAGRVGPDHDVLRPVFLHGQNPHVHALYRALVRRWSRSFRVPEHLLRPCQELMADRWSSSAGEWLRSLRADFDVRPSDVPYGEGTVVCEIHEREPIIKIVEGPLIALGNVLSGFSKQWSEPIDLLPESIDSVDATISFSDPVRVELLKMVRRALGYTERTLRPVLETEKPAVTQNNVGWLHWTFAGEPPFDTALVQTVRTTVTERADELKRGLHAPR